MNASDCAAWYAAVLATFVFVWDMVKWKRSGPRLKARTCQTPTGFVVTNVGDGPATIESVQVRLFQRRRLPWSKREVALSKVLGLFCGTRFLPLTLAPGEPWEAHIAPVVSAPPIPTFPTEGVQLVVEIVEAHRRRPYTYHPDSKKFLEHVNKRN